MNEKEAMLSEKVSKIVEDLLGIVDWALEIDYNPDKVINDTYSLIRERFKEERGSRGNITGLVEYMYTYLIRKKLEKDLNISFKTIKTNKKRGDHVYYFVAEIEPKKKLILTADIPLKNIKSETGNQFKFLRTFIKKKPDIFLAVKTETELIPIAYIEIKAVFSQNKTIRSLLETFTNFKNICPPSSKPYFVLINLNLKKSIRQSTKDLLEEFNKNLGDKYLRMFFRTEAWDDIGLYRGEYQGSILKIINKIVSKIKEY